MELVGRTLGQYRVEAEIGAGGMGIVYRAFDTTLERPVALKVLALEELEGSARKRLLREARAASALSHPGICTIHEVGELDGVAFIVMELVDGRALSELIQPGGLPIETVLRLGREIANGVAHAHRHGVLHCDLKSSNIAITGEGQAKVLDFGIARRLVRPEADGLTSAPTETREGGIAGTLAYMAPEVLRGDPPTEACDIWALGVILHEMATGRLPFGGASEAELVSSILRDPAAPAGDAIPASLRRVVLRCLAKEPSQRYASVGEVRAALETAAETLERGTPDVATTEPAETPPATRLLRSPLLALVAAGLVAVVVAAGWWLVREPGGAPEPVNFRLLSTFPGEHRAATLSPDGGMVAYLGTSEGAPEIWIKNLAEGDPVQITRGETAASRPRWSGRGDRIVFARLGQGIWSVPPLGGPERQLLAEGANPDLSNDGETMVFERGAELWIADAHGGGARRVEGVPERAYSMDLAPALSPDGSQVAFFVSELGPLGDLWVIPAEGGEARRLTFDVTEGGSPTWTPDGRFIVFSSARAGSRTLWRISPRGGEPVPVTTGAGEDSEPAISRHGATLVYTNVRNKWSLMVQDASSGDGRHVLERRSGILWPMASPDGRRVAYFGPDAHGGVQIFTVELDSGEVRQITHGRGEVNTMPRWSGDLEHLYYYQQRPRDSFRRIPLRGGPSVEVAPWKWEVEFAAAVHPGERFIAYTSRPAEGPVVARVRDLEDGRDTDLPYPLFHLSWSADAGYLLGAAGGWIYRCAFESLNDCERVTRGARPVLPGDGSRLYFLRPSETPGSAEIWVREMASGEERLVRVAGPFRGIDVHFHVTPSDEVVWAPFDEGRHELWLATLR